MAELKLEEILLTGFARLPEKSVLFSKYNGTISVTLLVNRSSGKILEVASEDFSPLQINYFNKLLRGEEISTEDGMFRIEQLLARNYQSSLRKPFYSGIRACRQKLEELREDKEDKIRKLLKQRDPVYTKFADVEMITGDKPFEDLIAQLEEKLKTCVKNS